MCTLLSGKAPVIGTRRIFLERNNIGDAGAASSVDDLWHSLRRPLGGRACLRLPQASVSLGQSAACSALAGPFLILFSSRCQAAR